MNSSYSYSDVDAHELQYIMVLYKVVLPIVFLFISAGGIIANGLVIFCLLYFSNLKTVPNIYIINLAIIDTLFLLSLPFIAYQYFKDGWPFGEIVCKYVNGMDTFNQYGSAWTLVAMSADRFVAVAYPLSSMQRRTRSCARMVCTIVIVWSLVLSSVNWTFAHVEYFPDHNQSFCLLSLPSNFTSLYTTYTALNFSLGFAFPLVFIIFFYMSIFYIMQSNDFFFQSDAKTAAQRASKRVAVLTIAVIVVFFICWMPYYSVQLKILLTDDHKSPFLSVFHIFTIAWCYMNSLFNPFVYTFVGENFRKNMSKLCFYGAQNLSRGRSGRGDFSSYTRSTMKLQPLKRNQMKATYCSPTDVTVDVSQESNNNAHTRISSA